MTTNKLDCSREAAFRGEMSVRTYNPSVRVGNWNEDLCLEEVRSALIP